MISDEKLVPFTLNWSIRKRGVLYGPWEQAPTPVFVVRSVLMSQGLSRKLADKRIAEIAEAADSATPKTEPQANITEVTQGDALPESTPHLDLLRENGVETIGEFLDADQSSLKNIGKKRFNEINDYLIKFLEGE